MNKCFVRWLKEESGYLTFPNLKRILFRQRPLFKTLYWTEQYFVLLLVLRDNRQISFQSITVDSRKASRYSYDIDFLQSPKMKILFD